MNVKLLRKVRDYIKKNPDKYNQQYWCGTECCVAGTTAFLSGKVPVRKVRASESYSDLGQSLSDIARRELKITRAQAERLFNAGWCFLPERYQVTRDMDPRDRAERAYDRINRFIETKGAE